MATTLAKRLAQLSVPQTKSYYISPTQKPSLLFDPKEAAALDLDTVLAIGVNGIEELDLIVPLFRVFKNSLFSETSKHVARSTQTRAQNDQLDKEIRRFLQLLSPLLLLKPAHKALEWLVHRFQIHSYNCDDLLLSALPYHETKIFVRIVQLVDLNYHTKWQWLLPLQKSGASLSKITLINHLRTDLVLLNTIAKMVAQAMENRDEFAVLRRQGLTRTKVSFYATAVVGVLEFGKVSENLISALLPHLKTGLRSQDEDYAAASCMITAQLLKKVRVKRELVVSLVTDILAGMVNVTRAMDCVLLIFLVQDTKKLPKEVLSLLCVKVKAVKVMVEFSQRYAVSAVVRQMLRHLFTDALSAKKKCRVKALKRIFYVVSNAKLNKKDVGFAVRVLLKIYTVRIKIRKKDGRIAMRKIVSDILTKFENRLPTEFDAAIKSVGCGDCPQKIKGLLSKFMFVSGGKGKSLTLSSLATNVAHADADRRALVTKRLVECLARNSCGNRFELMRDALLTRLTDDQETVVVEALMSHEVLMMLPRKELFPVLKKILDEKILDENRVREYNTALKVFCEIVEKSKTREALVTVIPYLFRDISREPYVDTVLGSSLSKENSILRKVSKKIASWPRDNGHIEQISAFLHFLAVSVSKSADKKLFDELLHFKSRDKFPVIPLVVAAVTRKTESPISQLLISDTVDWLKPGLLESTRMELEFKNWENVLEVSWSQAINFIGNQEPSEDLSFVAKVLCLNSVIERCTVPESLKNSDWWLRFDGRTAMDSDANLQLRILEMLMELTDEKHGESATPFRLLTKTFVAGCFEDPQEFLKLNVLAWTPVDDREMTEELAITRVRSLVMSHTIFAQLSSKKFPSRNFDLSKTVVPSLLVCLGSPLRSVRKAALASFQSISMTNDATVFGDLVSKICGNYTELLTDQSLLPQFLKVFFVDPRKPKTAERLSRTQALSSLLQLVTAEDTPTVFSREILRCLKEVVTTQILTALLPMVERKLRDPAALGVSELEIVNLTFEKFVPETADVLRTFPRALEIFLKGLGCAGHPAGFSSSPQAVAAKQVTRRFFDAMRDNEAKEIIFERLIALQVDNGNPDSVRKLAKALKNIAVYPEHIVKGLEWSDAVNKSPAVSSIRKKKQVQSSTRESADVFWKRVVILLEVLQRKKNIANVHHLIPTIFDVLKKCLEVEEQETMEYVKQLLLTVLHLFCQQLMGDPKMKPSTVLKVSHFSIELVIQSIRTSKNPQTHNQALLLIGVAAQIFPDYVLHNTMAIFTFMGANLLRQDDSYSSQVIIRTLDTLIPALISKRQAEGKAKGVKETIVMVIRVFVDALPDIPQHRRAPLFMALASKIGAEQFLWVLLALLLESYVTRPKGSGGFSAPMAAVDSPVEEPKKESNKMSNLTPEFEFMLQICNQYSASCQISVCCQLMRYLHALPVDIDDKVQPKRQRSYATDFIFNLQRHSATKLRYFKYATLGFLCSLLSAGGLVTQLVSTGSGAEVEPLFKDLLECTTQHLQLVAAQCDKCASMGGATPVAKFWRAIQHKVYDVLEKVNALLPSETFVRVMSSLLENERASVRRKAMEILNGKLQHNPQFFQGGDVEELLGMLKPLVKMVRRKGSGSDREEVTVNTQTALFSIKLLCKLFGQEHHDSFKNLTELICKLIQSETVHPHVCASGLVCLAQLCQTVGVHIISHIGSCVTVILTILGDERVAGNELLLLSALTAIHKFVERLHHFLSPYLHGIISRMCLLTGKSIQNSKSAVKIKSAAILQNIATSVAPRVLFPVIAGCSREFCDCDTAAMEPLMDILRRAITAMDKENVAAQNQFLLSYFFTVLDFRAEHQQKSLEDVEEVEGHIIEPILSLVLKMSEAMFRPFYFKLYDWATRAEAPSDRVLVFYRLSDCIAEKLKSLFVLFAGNIVKHAASILDRYNKNKEAFDTRHEAKGCVLVNYVIDCLYKCCLYDNEGFVNKERFDYLMQPLVDQIENTMGTESEYQKRIVGHLVPCLAQLAAAASDEALWKTLNYEILLKTRNSLPKVRFATLDVVCELNKKLGDNYMVLLPETIPFLAELMEDESSEVEQKCRTVVSEMEKTLGESIQNYF